MRDPKIVLAASVRNALLRDTVAINQDGEDFEWDVTVLSDLLTEVKVRRPGQPSRFFTVRVREHH